MGSGTRPTQKQFKKIKIKILFGLARTEWGHLANPQLAWHSDRQEPLFELQRRYEAILVWSYTTLIVIEAVVNRKLAAET